MWKWVKRLGTIGAILVVAIFVLGISEMESLEELGCANPEAFKFIEDEVFQNYDVILEVQAETVTTRQNQAPYLVCNVVAQDTQGMRTTAIYSLNTDTGIIKITSVPPLF